MSTDLVTQEVAQSKSLIEKATTYEAMLAAALTARAQSLGQQPFDAGPVVRTLAAMLGRAADDAQASQAQHGALKSHVSAPQAQRDLAVQRLRHGLRDGHNALVARYGPDQVATAFPTGKTPRFAEPLITFATQAIAGVRQAYPTWQDRTDGVVSVPVDTAALLTALQNLLDQLQQAMHAFAGASNVVATTAAATASQHDALHEVHKGLFQVLSGLMEAAGLSDQVDDLVRHHHVGHPMDPNPVTKPA